jgi:hypothetical protein
LITVQKKSQTEGITIRVGKETLASIRKEARDRQVSTNTLISQIFLEYIDWHSSAAKAGFIPIRTSILRKMLGKMSEQDIESMAHRVAKGESEDFVLLLRDEYNLASTLDVIERWIRISGYPYKESKVGSVRSFVIQHDLGRKWSVFLSELYKMIFESFDRGELNVKFTDSTVHLSFHEM